MNVATGVCVCKQLLT